MHKFFKSLFTNNIVRSSAGLVVITLSVKLLGYVEKLLLANYFGTSYRVDVYTVVMTIVLSIFLFFKEIVEPGFLNVFLNIRSKGEDATSWGLFNQGLRLILIVTVLISLVALIFPESFVKIFAPGFEGEKLELCKRLIKIAVPACVFLSLSTLTNITLNGLKIFILPASGELAFKGGIIVCMVLFYKGYGIEGVTIGIVIGSIGKLIVHLTRLYKRVSFKKVKVEGDYRQRIWLLTWPLLIGVSFSQLSSLVDNIFASYLHEGAIAALSYAKKVVELPVIIFPYVISIVIFPYFSQLAIEKQQERLKEMLAGALKWITIVFLPIAAFFFIYSVPIVKIIFQRGAFTADSTLLTARPLMIYSIGMVFFAIETILVIFYYANADTKTPIFVGIACVVLNILLTWTFIGLIGYVGIALAFVVQKVVKNLILLYLIKRKIAYDRKNLLLFLTKALVSFIVFLVFISVCKYYTDGIFDHALIERMCVLALNFSIGSFMYFLVLKKWGVIKMDRAAYILH